MDTDIQKKREHIAKFEGCISVGWGHTVGLKSDGTAVAVGRNDMGDYQQRQCEVDGTLNIITVIADRTSTFLLHFDGTVTAVGSYYNVSGLSGIASVSLSSLRSSPSNSHTEFAIYLKSDGTVVVFDWDQRPVTNNFGDWRNIVAIATGDSHTVGLKSDGTLVADGYYQDCRRINVSEWRNIVAIAAGSSHTVGLKSDGTVVADGENKNGQCDVNEWRNIVAIAANYGRTTFGLKSDGTVIAVGENKYGQCNVGGWRNIVAIAGGGGCTVGLKSDGTVVAVGENEYRQCNVSGWRGIGPSKERLQWKSQGLCGNCGGERIGFLFFKKCKSCGQ